METVEFASKFVFVLTAVFRAAAPILLAAEGSLLMGQGGIVNIGIEGILLVGACGATLGSALGGSFPICFALACAVLLGAVFASLVVYCRADDIIAGAGLNMLALGLTTTLSRMMPTALSPAAMGKTDAPFALYFLAFAFIPLISVFLRKTNAGLSLRATGINFRAASAAGINVRRAQFLSCLAGAALAGLGGALLSLGTGGIFVENMSAGRGFIALAVASAAGNRPLPTLALTLLFGAGLALESRLQISLGTASLAVPGNLPPHVFILIPYLLTLAALCLPRRRDSAA